MGEVPVVRWGILGAGRIATRFAQSLAHVEGAELVAASRRSEEKARSFLDSVLCAEGTRAYGDHAALLADDEVDALYLALPHAFHAEWALRAFDAGKAVLCEKPACLDAAEMERVSQAARSQGLLFMEAMKTRFVPLHAAVRSALPALGAIGHVRASLCNDALAALRQRDTYILGGGPGSGVLLDCGIYCASWLEELLPGEFRVERAEATWCEGSDVYVRAELVMGGVPAILECACDRAKPRQLVVEGERGTLTVDDLHRPQHAELRFSDGSVQNFDSPYVIDDFYGEVRHFCDLMEAGAVESSVMPHAASIRCARILDLIRAAI